MSSSASQAAIRIDSRTCDTAHAHPYVVTSVHDLPALFRARYCVFVDEMGYYPPSVARRLFNRHDFEAPTRNLLVRCGDVVAAAVRLVNATNGPTEAEALFPFAEHLPAGARAGAVTMLFVDPDHRRNRGVLSSLLELLHAEAARDGYTHLFCALAPPAERPARERGYRRLAPRFFHEEHGLWVSPMLLDMRELRSPSTRTVQPLETR